MTAALLFALILSAFIGVTLGLLGSGGSIVTLPVLVYVAGIPTQQAVGMALAVVGGTAGVGAAVYYRRGTFDPRAAGFFAATGVTGAFFGARLTHLVDGRLLMGLFGLLMVGVGIRMIRERGHVATRAACRPLHCLSAGLGVGVLTGFLGVGGGFLILPALLWFAGIGMKEAVGTSLAVIALNSAGGLAGQLRYVDLPWGWTLAFLLVSLAGMWAGTSLANRLPASHLRRGFAWAVTLLGILLLVSELWELGT